MAISGVGSYPNSYGYYGLPKINAIHRSEAEQAEQVNQTGATPDEQTAQTEQTSQEKQELTTAHRLSSNSNSGDFSFDFKKHNEFQLVGATNKIEDMDVEKAISDMKKDAVLDQYKFFVNSNNLGTDQDGTVRKVQRR